MARITFVKKAQQRYETVPVIDPETGQQKQTPVMRKDGTQKTTKHGRPVFMKVTKEDRTKPKPNLRCDYPGCPDPEIRPGQSYKHITPKSGPYGGRQRNRHAEHPNWNVWEYSSSLDARLAEIQNTFEEGVDNCESEDDVTSLLEDVANAARELAEEKRESASNIEEGFGHETEKSMELNDIAEQIEAWADEVEGMSVPDFPSVEDVECDTCQGEGTIEDENGEQQECEDCGGTGHPEEPTEEQIGDWLDEVRSAFPEPSL